MKTKQRTALVITLFMVFSVAGFWGTVDYADAAVKPKKIYLKTSSKYVDIKGKVTVSVKSVRPIKASKAVTWKTSNKRIATVSKKGVVTGKKKGKVTITATSKKNKKVKKSITIYVKQMKPKVSMPTSATLYSGINKTIKATVGPKGVWNKGITYVSSNTSVATVNSAGVVTPLKGGTVTITAKSKESSKYKDSTAVTVKQSITGITFPIKSIYMNVGDTSATPANAATVSPANAYTKAVTYKSSNTGIATVSSTGQVKALKAGTVTITATANDVLKRASGSYTVNVGDIIGPIPSGDGTDNGIFTLDSGIYKSFAVSATKPGSTTPVKVELTPADLNEAFDIASSGVVGTFNWKDATSVRDNFGASSFDFSLGTDFIFSKAVASNKVTIKIPGDIVRTSWYYVAGRSFIPGEDPLVASSDYQIKLFQNIDGSGDFIVLSRRGDTLSAVKAGRSMEINAVDNDTIEAAFTSGASTLSATLVKGSDGQYEISASMNDINAYSMNVIAYK